MRRKSIYRLFAAAICTTVLSGCSKSVELTTEQNNIIANYAARLIVKATYVDYTYTPDIKEPVPQETTEPEDNRTPEEIKNENTKEYNSFAQTLDMGKFVITYKDTVISNEYPVDNNALFVLPAEKGYKLIVIEFNMYNPTEESISYSSKDEAAIFRLVIDDKTSVRSFMNILPNDFSNMKNFTVQPGESNTAIIVFQVEDKVADNLSSIKVQYNKNGVYRDLPLDKLN